MINPLNDFIFNPFDSIQFKSIQFDSIDCILVRRAPRSSGRRRRTARQACSHQQNNFKIINLIDLKLTKKVIVRRACRARNPPSLSKISVKYAKICPECGQISLNFSHNLVPSEREERSSGEALTKAMYHSVKYAFANLQTSHHKS
eukprot:COSAG04_NODE_3433_length_2818_cov_3.307834_2_plen_146_part_00